MSDEYQLDLDGVSLPSNEWQQIPNSNLQVCTRLEDKWGVIWVRVAPQDQEFER